MRLAPASDKRAGALQLARACHSVMAKFDQERTAIVSTLIQAFGLTPEELVGPLDDGGWTTIDGAGSSSEGDTVNVAARVAAQQGEEWMPEIYLNGVKLRFTSGAGPGLNATYQQERQQEPSPARS